MTKSFSQAVSTSCALLLPIFGGALFFFAIIGVFGLWFAIGGLLIAVIIALAIITRIPVEASTR